MEVTRESTVEVGIRLSGEDVVALNFASGISVGGGVMSGAVAQEEDLCRSGGLYGCINGVGVEDYYEENLKDEPIYKDNMIYSPWVPFFRDVNLELMTEVIRMSIITSCAPCIRDIEFDDDKFWDIMEIFKERMRKVFRLGMYMGHRIMILGAWGCGAFGNHADVVARLFKGVIGEDEFAGVFDRIIFGVYAKDEWDLNYVAFREVLGK